MDVCTSQNSARISTTQRSWFDRCVEDAGIVDFTWHCLRHTFISRLVMKGVDLRTVQELAGHKTISMTVRYAHLAPDGRGAGVQGASRFGRADLLHRTGKDRQVTHLCCRAFEADGPYSRCSR